MSTFFGLIEEIPGISVDRFDGENLNSSAYFLSHCHTDHMHGLSPAFFEHLKQFKKYLYCTPISKAFLEAKFYNVETCVRDTVKDIAVDNKKYPIRYESEDYDNSTNGLYVTFVSAGHCPGSVMFLFEKIDKLILYTGDFRINPSDYSKIKLLHHPNNFPMKFTKVYLDTTFLDPDFTFFPRRTESLNLMCKVVRNWLEKSPRKVVVLECSALYGSEFLYMKLSNVFNMPTHVQDCVYERYCRIPDLARHITNDPLSTQIHACMSKHDSMLQRSGLICRTDILKEDILTIVSSALKWRGKNTSVVGESDCTRKNTYNICYSTHASYDELKKFIRYFEPEEIYPCVCPEKKKDKVFDLLSEIISEIKREKGDAVEN